MLIIKILIVFGGIMLISDIILLSDNKKQGVIDMKKIILRFSGVIASLALMVTSLNVNTCCLFLWHQPKLPKGAEKLYKY